MKTRLIDQRRGEIGFTCTATSGYCQLDPDVRHTAEHICARCGFHDYRTPRAYCRDGATGLRQITRQRLSLFTFLAEPAQGRTRLQCAARRVSFHSTAVCSTGSISLLRLSNASSRRSRLAVPVRLFLDFTAINVMEYAAC